MQVALVLVFFLCFVHSNLGNQNDEKEAQVKSQIKITMEELANRNVREAGKGNSGKKNKKGKRPRKNSESITKKKKKNKIKQGLKKISKRKRQKEDKKSIK